ncbi:MAG: outer membrane lipoprotein-sorting protein, partial [Chlorobi bacterium]|nr:outer membrane lipoprotein-sorting protein [Chlorobiota bacterium]
VAEIKDKMKVFSPTGKVDQYDFYGNEIKESALPSDLTAIQVVDNYIKARGGKENLLKVKSVKSSAEAKIQGMTINIETWKKAPNMLCSETTMNGNLLSKQVCDGTNAKVVSMQGEQKLAGKMLEQMIYDSYLFPELEYSKDGYELELLGIEDVNGEPAYKITVVNPAGTKQTLYFSKETGLLIKEVTQTPQGVITALFKEYKDVDGVKFPVKVTQSAGPQMFEIEVNNVEVNKDIDDSKFEI